MLPARRLEAPARLDGARAREVPWTTLAHALSMAQTDPEPWLYFHKGEHVEPLSRATALGLARGWAVAMYRAGVRSGDTVAVLQPNAPEFIGAFFGAQLLGVAAVPLPWPVVLGNRPVLPKGAEPMLAAAKVRAICAPEGLETPLPCITGAAHGAFTAYVTPDTTAFVQFTSGSTGAPRGAAISHRAALASAWAMAGALKLDGSDVGVSWLPFFHDMGLVGVLLSSLLARFPVHVLRPAEVLLHPRRWLDVLSGAGATLTVAPNFGYELLVRRGGGPEALSLGMLRAALSGSEPVLRSTIDAFESRFAPAGLRRGAVLPVYGLAENTLGVTFSRPGEPVADLCFEGRQVPSVGAPLEGTEVAVRRADGTVAAGGEEGEITVRGPSVMRGYAGDPQASLRALRGEWLWTGDRGVVHGGHLYVTGRDKDLVIKAGRKFHPADIEREVAQVVDTPPNGVAAFSVLREELRGEELIIVVEATRSPPEQVERAVRGRLAEALGVTADRVVVVKAGALPRTTSGKLRRAECTARFGGVSP
jgi:fatty-acyl-CoA synthase